jgi:hypothetical protein
MEAFDPDDELKAENALLRLKLEMEHGMGPNHTENLNPELENQWLRYIYDFEKLSKETPERKVYDLIGRPAFKLVSQLSTEEIAPELEKLLELMFKNGIALDYADGYDDAVIYKFITEELFDHKTRHIEIEGMVSHFIYEEFHPNHDHDIRHRITDFFQALLQRPWEHQYDGIWLADSVSWHGKDFSPTDVTRIIQAFQEANQDCKLLALNINRVDFDLNAETGKALGSIEYFHGIEKIQGSFLFELVLIDQWEISSIQIPGLNA